MTRTKITRAYIKLIDNKKARTSASDKYFHVFSELGEAYLFTNYEMEKAQRRAKKNPEDVYPVEFTEPEPKVIEKEVIKYVEVEKIGSFEEALHGYFTSEKADLEKSINDTGDWNDDIEKQFTEVVEQFKKTQTF